MTLYFFFFIIIFFVFFIFFIFQKTFFSLFLSFPCGVVPPSNYATSVVHPPRWPVLVDRILVINLPHRLDRWVHMQNLLATQKVFQGIPVQRLNAIPGDQLNLLAMHAREELSSAAYQVGGGFVTKGALGCFLSHREAWRLIAQTNRSMIVFEDDIEFTPAFEATFPMVGVGEGELPSDFGIFYFADMVQNEATLKRSTSTIQPTSIESKASIGEGLRIS